MFRPRRRSVVLLVVLLTVLGGVAPALGQEATPASAGDRLFADLGLPELTITATDEGFALSESEVAAGRYLVTVINESSAPEALAGFARLTDGRTLDDLSFADELAAGTPMPEEGPPPESYLWLFEAYIPGGTIATSEAPGQVVVDLRGGDYGVWTLDPIPATALTVTGDPEARIEGPVPGAAVTIVEEGAGGEGFRFTVNGEVQAGPQIIEVLNASDQPHEVIGEQYPDPLTMEQIMASLMFDPTSGATPPPDLVDEERLTMAGYAGVQSIGTTQWVVMDFDPGQAVFLCFVPDPVAEGIPHAMEGMISLVPVAES
jgi:hypothetical protein